MLNNRTRILIVGMLVVMSTLFGVGFSEQAWAQRSANVKDVENPDKQIIVAVGPFMGTLEDGINQTDVCYSQLVPAGKRWVIENVSVMADMLTSGQVPAVKIHMASPFHNAFLPLTYQGGPFVLTLHQGYLWYANAAVKLRIEAGSSFCAQFNRGNGNNGIAYLFVSFSGYEIDYP